MRLRQIEIFYHVYKCGSVSGAARDLNVSQPSVSKVLRYAEDQLGFDLFIRDKGRLSPTPAAHELFEEIKDIYRRISSFNRTADNIKNRKGGHLRLGVLPALGLTVAPAAIANLRESDPNLSFELATLHSGELLQAVLEKKHDLCIGFEAPADERVKIRHLADGDLHLVSLEPINGATDSVSVEILDEADFVGIKGSGPLATILADKFETLGIRPNEVVTAHTYHVALSLVREGIGLAVTDQFTARSPLGEGLNHYRIEGTAGFPIYGFALVDHLEPDNIEGAMNMLETVLRSTPIERSS